MSNKNLRFLFVGELIGILGDFFSEIANLSVIERLSDNDTSIALFFLISNIPGMICFSFSGYFADKFSRTKVMITTEVFRFLLVGLLYIAETQDVLVLIYIANFLKNCFGTFFGPAKDSILVSLIDKKNLALSNSLFGGMHGVAVTFGMAIGGFLSNYFGIKFCYMVDAGTYLVSVYFLFQIHKNFNDEDREGNYDKSLETRQATDEEQSQLIEEHNDEKADTPEETKEELPLIEELKQGFYWLLENGDIMYIMAQKIIGNLVIGALDVAGIKFANELFTLGQDTGSLSLGLLWSLAGFGITVGTVLSQKWNAAQGDTPVSRRMMVGVAITINMVSIIFYAWSPDVEVFYISTFVWWAAEGMLYTFCLLIVQSNVPEIVRGRVNSIYFLFRLLTHALGAMFMGILFDDTNMGLHYAASVAILVYAPLVLAFWLKYFPSFKARTEGAAEEEDVEPLELEEDQEAPLEAGE